MTLLRAVYILDSLYQEAVSIYGLPRSIKPAVGKGYLYSYGQYDTIFDIHSYDREVVSGFYSGEITVLLQKRELNMDHL